MIHKSQHLVTLMSFILMIFLGGCVQMTAAPGKAQNKQEAWSTRYAQLLKINTWRIEGAMAVHNDKQAQSANVTWIQKAQRRYKMYLSGPLGAGAMELSGRPDHVRLQTGDGKTHEATSPEALLASVQGWHLPVSNLYYWIRGVPAPGGGAVTQFDKVHHLTSLKQQGWTIQFTRYTAVRGIDLPSKLRLARGKLRIKMVVSQWQLSQA